MSSEPSKLDTLPFDILYRIASLGDCDATLSLSKVNKALRAACNDHLVYKAILNNSDGALDSKWQHHLPLSKESPVSSWARYALADFKAAQDHTSSFKPEVLVSWAPQLMAYHHPFLDLANASTLIDAFKTNETDVTASTHALAYCFALRVMSKKPAGGLMFHRHIGNVFNGSRPTQRDLRLELKKSLYLPADDSSHFSVYSPKMLMQRRTQALVTVGLYSVILRRYLEGLRYRNLHRVEIDFPMSVPTSNRIPFHSMMDLPLPFSPTATIDLASCHMAKMATADFLEDGEWAGYYSTTRKPHSYPILQTPMHETRFFATRESDSASTLNLQGTGSDGTGAFDLVGTLLQKTGQILLTKRYPEGQVWSSVGIMTPMGIVGAWGSRDYGGWIWMWKTSWTAGL